MKLRPSPRREPSRKPDGRAAVDLDRVLQVKFVDGLRPAIRRRRLVLSPATEGSRARRASAAVRVAASLGGRWFPLHASSAGKLEKLMARARARRPKKALPDLLSYYVLQVSPSEDPVEVANRLRRLKEVEFVDLMPRPRPLPAVPDFDQPGNSTGFFQGYLRNFDPAGGSTGIGAESAWWRNLTGAGIRFCDVEYNFNRNHREYRDRVTILGGDPVNPAGLDADDVTSHGTSVIGEFGSKRSDDKGTVGIAYGAELYFSPVITWLWPNIADAITRAAVEFDDGDIIIVEQQIDGPGRPWFAEDQEGLVAVEWDRGIYDAIVVAVAAGLTVVEAAGNGGDDFDSVLFLRAGINRGHHPFLRSNDSGAIIVGAGDSATQARLAFTNFGRRVDLQGWGNRIVTASGPRSGSDLWTEDGINREYTRTFGGTSGATPMVAGACALVQQAFKRKYGRAATCEELRALLVESGNPQAPESGSSTRNIGPLPDVRRALDLVEGAVERPVFAPDPAAVHAAPLRVRLAYGTGTNSANATIRFTIDGSEPGTSSPRFRTGGPQPTLLLLTASTLVKARTFMDDPDPFDGSARRSDVVHGNYQLLDASLPAPDLYVDEVDHYSGDTVVRVHVEPGYLLGSDAMIWYNVDQSVDPVQFVAPNSLYTGRIRLSQPGTYVIRSRYCMYDGDLMTWTPGPVAVHTFTVA